MGPLSLTAVFGASLFAGAGLCVAVVALNKRGSRVPWRKGGPQATLDPRLSGLADLASPSATEADVEARLQQARDAVASERLSASAEKQARRAARNRKLVERGGIQGARDERP